MSSDTAGVIGSVRSALALALVTVEPGGAVCSTQQCALLGARPVGAAGHSLAWPPVTRGSGGAVCSI